MSFNGNGSNCNGNNGGDEWFVKHIRKFVGENVLVFTTSGGASGSGFDGVLMEVNNEFIRLINRQSSPPTCPISDVCNHSEEYYDSSNGTMNGSCQNGGGNHHKRSVGSITDIPIDRIAAFCHNAV